MALISANGRNWSCKNLSTAEDALLSLLLAALLLTRALSALPEDAAQAAEACCPLPCLAVHLVKASLWCADSVRCLLRAQAVFFCILQFCHWTQRCRHVCTRPQDACRGAALLRLLSCPTGSTKDVCSRPNIIS